MQLNKIKKAFPYTKAEQCEVFEVGDKILVTKNFLCTFYKVGSRTVEGWTKKGLPVVEESPRGLNLYELLKVIVWHESNIKRNSSKKIIEGSTNEDLTGIRIEDMSIEQITRWTAIQEYKTKELKYKKENEELVPADETDKVTAEIVASFVGFLRNSRANLSRDLENKTKEDIESYLDIHYGDYIEDMRKRVDVQGEDSITIYEFIDWVQNIGENYKEKIESVIEKINKYIK